MLHPGFAGIATFLRAIQAGPDMISPSVIAVTGVPLDAAEEPRGTWDGPRAIREASVTFVTRYLPSMRGALVEVESERRLEFTDEVPLVDVGNIDPRASASDRVEECLRDHAFQLAGRASLTMFLGGTRAITGPLLRGIAQATGKRIALLRLSSTMDLRDERADGRLCPGSSFLVALRGSAGAACLGVHGLLPAAEWLKARSQSARVLPLPEWRRLGLRETAQRVAKELLSESDQLYLSLDIRVTDATFAPARDRVVVGGLTPVEFLDVCDGLAGFPLVAIDMVEVAPSQDSTGRTEHLAFQALLALVAPRLAHCQA